MLSHRRRRNSPSYEIWATPFSGRHQSWALRNHKDGSDRRKRKDGAMRMLAGILHKSGSVAGED
ncbi:hypothetical protein TIFTF001_001643 [Ficus carica]|uniref:Uncharacterized protein n=1 Tax=Ficus carica TaxID=3494 RepID=A0AA88CQS8_FICCA|nr:hypothetical protein TIFTF001_001643 [Ficus carica]